MMSLLILAVVLMAVDTLTTIPNDNTLISSGRPTQQRTTGNGGNSSRAVDGNTDGNFNRNSCAHSPPNVDNWWRVYFDSNYAVSKVVVYNRQDCCQDRINGAMVFVGNEYESCGTIKYEPGKVIYSIDCNKALAVGVHVTIRQFNNYLTLCEVKVYGERDDNTLISSGRRTEQSSIGHGGDSIRAVDGETCGWYDRNTCTHTESNTNNWWRVYLDSDYAVSRVVIYNREDCCEKRLNGAMVYVGDEYCGTIKYESGKAIYRISCNNGVGGAVTIKQPNDILTLCEVKVYGKKSENKGSAVVKIKNRKDVSKDKKSGKSFVIICGLELVNVDIEKPNDPNNVDWYKIVPGQLPIKITEETHGDQFGFIKKRGDYRLRFVFPTPNESGTYRCQFEKDNIKTSTDVTVNVV